MTKAVLRPKLELPEGLRRVLPAARWERIETNLSTLQVWNSQRYQVKVRDLSDIDGQSLQQERERLRWLVGRIPLPELVGHEVTDTHEYLATTRLRGISLDHPDALLHAERLINLLARALREIHALPIRECPFDLSLRRQLALARHGIQTQAIQLENAVALFNELARQRPSTEDVVVTHGQAVLSSFVIHGEWLEGVLNVGSLGIADRHVDLTCAYQSISKHLNKALAEQFLDAYGRELVQPEHLVYYEKLGKLMNFML